MSCQGQLELLRLLFTEALYDEYLSRVSGSAPQIAQERWPGLPLGLCWFLASPKFPEALQSKVLLQAAGLSSFVCPFCSGSLQKAFGLSSPSLGPMAKA